jgi:cyclic beta-1,2-glucan synthetase
MIPRQRGPSSSESSGLNSMPKAWLISDIDWADLFESVSLVDARLRTGSGFAAMDFPSRNLYRSAIEQLARGSDLTELEIADRALAACDAAAPGARTADPGWHLIAGGRRGFEREIGFRPPPGPGSAAARSASASPAISARPSS